MASQWAWWCLRSPALRLFTQPFIREQIKENIKAPLYWPFVRRIHRGPVNSPHKWPVTRKVFPFDDVIMSLRLLPGNHTHIEGILPKGPYLPCVSMAGRALLAGYPRHTHSEWIILERKFSWSASRKLLLWQFRPNYILDCHFHYLPFQWKTRENGHQQSTRNRKTPNMRTVPGTPFTNID